MTAGVEKIFSAMPNVGFLAHAATLAAEAAAPGVTDARVAEVSQTHLERSHRRRDDRILYRGSDNRPRRFRPRLDQA